MLSYTQAAAAAGWSPRLFHTDVAWAWVATVTHSHQLLQHLMNINQLTSCLYTTVRCSTTAFVWDFE